ncbi:MAG: diguanylate cyclase, partial [Leptospirillum sp. Group IV 'UBA BS']
MPPDPSYDPLRFLLVRPTGISGDRWDSIVQTLIQLSDPNVVLAGVIDPLPTPNILIVAEMDGIPIVPSLSDIAPDNFTHLALEDAHPDILSPSGKPWPRIPFSIVSLLAEQVASKNQYLAIFNRYRAFAQSLTNLIPLERALRYESLVCQSLRTLLSARAVAYCESRTRTRSVTIRTSDPVNLYLEDCTFPLTEAVRAILANRNGYFDDIELERAGITPPPLTVSTRVVVFKLVQGTASNTPFLMIYPLPFPQTTPFP